MRIDDMPAITHDWPEHTKLTEGDSLETVRIVEDDYHPNYLRAESEREVGPARTPRKSSDGPALLIHRPSADDHHDVAVRAMVEQVRLAYDALSLPKTGAQAWAYSINYWEDVRDELYEAVARIQHALDLIDIHENG